MNGSVSLPVSIKPGERSPFHVKTSRAGYTQFCWSCLFGCVQVSVTQKGDYLMFDNSHYLKTRVATVSTLILHRCLILAKYGRHVAQAFEELYHGKSHKTSLK